MDRVEGSLLAIRSGRIILRSVSRRGFSTKRAFSLLESLVVMLVIILLASIIIPGLMGRGGEAPKLPAPKPSSKEERTEELEEPEPVSAPDPESVPPKSESAEETSTTRIGSEF